jgi:hypothetical protein
MKSKKNFLDTRSLLIILIVIVIVGGAYLIISNLPPEEDFLTPENVLANKETYLNQNIKVRGFYIVEENPIVVSTLSTVEGRAELRIIDNVNATDDIFAEEKYDFTGELIRQDTPTGFDVILDIEKINAV